MDETCYKCGYVGKLTDDHRIPRWLVRRVGNFGVKGKTTAKNIQRLCRPCNAIKAGYMDYSDPIVREYLKDFIQQVGAHIKRFET